MVKYWGIESEGFKDDADLLELYVSSGLLINGYRLQPWRDVYPGDQRYKITAKLFSKSKISPVKTCQANFTIVQYEQDTTSTRTLFNQGFEAKGIFMTTSDCAWKISEFMRTLPKCGLGQ